MYEAELLPMCLSIGIEEERFWRLNPRRLSAYREAEILKAKRLDYEMWQMGAYIHEAVSTVVGNALRKKGAVPLKYPDKPYMERAEEEKASQNLSEEEKIRKTELLFKSLQIMKVNHDLEKKFSGDQAS